MELLDYQRKSRKMAIYPGMAKDLGIYYTALGLTGEAGEIANKVKKILRDEKGLVTQKMKDDLQAELGDVLWYVAALATELDLNLDVVAHSNLEKLQSRLKRGTIVGSGDKR